MLLSIIYSEIPTTKNTFRNTYSLTLFVAVSANFGFVNLVALCLIRVLIVKKIKKKEPHKLQAQVAPIIRRRIWRLNCKAKHNHRLNVDLHCIYLCIEDGGFWLTKTEIAMMVYDGFM